jgi:hypothetical protein
MPTSSRPKYGVLNTKNFQQLVDDCLADSLFRSEVASFLRTSVPTFFLTYFDIHAAADQHFTSMVGTDI